MMQIRRSEDRGHADHGWLNAKHSFSFADYYDRQWMGYSTLRVINEDRVAPGTGFGAHGHRDMEIITYPLSGAVRHQDSTGGQGVIRHGEIQVMHAGRGIQHSEANPSHSEPLHLLQIWLEPNALGVHPGYEQAALDGTALRAGWSLVVCPMDGDAAAPFHIHADARLWMTWPGTGQQLPSQPLAPQRRYYLHVAAGAVTANGHTLTAGDALLLQQETTLDLKAATESEVLLFDLP